MQANMCFASGRSAARSTSGKAGEACPRAGRDGVHDTQARVTPAMLHTKRLVQSGFVGEAVSTALSGWGRIWGATIDDLKTDGYLLDKANGATMLTIPFAHARGRPRRARRSRSTVGSARDPSSLGARSRDREHADGCARSHSARWHVGKWRTTIDALSGWGATRYRRLCLGCPWHRRRYTHDRADGAHADCAASIKGGRGRTVASRRSTFLVTV